MAMKNTFLSITKEHAIDRLLDLRNEGHQVDEHIIRLTLMSEEEWKELLFLEKPLPQYL